MEIGIPFLVGLLALGGFRSTAAAEQVQWASNYAKALEQARVEQKLVMVDFFTSWCGWCKVLDQKTYSDKRVTDLTDRMVCVKVNAEVERAVAAGFSIRGYPTIIVLNPDGSLRRRYTGYQPPEAFAPALQEALKSDTELFALASQVRAAPRDGVLRQDYARILARSGDLGNAALQADTLLSLDGVREDFRTEAALDRWIWRLRAGGEDGRKEIRKGLEKWVKKMGKGHARRTEGLYFLGLAEEQDGKAKDARKRFEEIMKVAPGSWFADEARSRLSTAGS